MITKGESILLCDFEECEPVTERHIASGVVEALGLWSEERYKQYLGRYRHDKLDKDWFKWFVGRWNVARTIRKGKKDYVRKYLNRHFCRMLAADRDGTAIDRAALSLRKQRLTAKAGQMKEAVLPVSMVSKVAFFFDPSKYVPMDRLGKKGLNQLRGTKVADGVGHSSFDTYAEYLIDFDWYFWTYEPLIKAEIEEEWSQVLSAKFDVPKRVTRSKAFRRKVFDNILMSIGRSSEN